MSFLVNSIFGKVHMDKVRRSIIGGNVTQTVGRIFNIKSPEKATTNPSVTIGTHDGAFHCDEALACFMLKRLPEFQNATIVRTRDTNLLNTMDVVVDVGGVYDPQRRRYDHHQRGFHETFNADQVVKLSSAGLVYRHFGRDFIASLVPATGEDLETLYQKVYFGFVHAIDAIDNGHPQYPDNVQAAYAIRTDISSRVSKMNPAWNQVADDETRLSLFHQAMDLVGKEIQNLIYALWQSWMPARVLVKEAIERSTRDLGTTHIVVLERYVAWPAHLHALEEELRRTPDEKAKYILFPNINAAGWKVQAVAVSPSSFVSRKALPESWRGLSGEALDAATGITDCVFVHASGFIGGHSTLQGALEMAKRALRH